MSYLKIASKVMDRKAGEFACDRDLFVSGLNEYERIAYHELTKIMTDKERWASPGTRHLLLSPEEAHKTAKAIIERYRDNQRGSGTHAKAN